MSKLHIHVHTKDADSDVKTANNLIQKINAFRISQIRRDDLHEAESVDQDLFDLEKLISSLKQTLKRIG